MMLSVFGFFCAYLSCHLWINDCTDPLSIELFVFLLLICKILCYRHKFFLFFIFIIDLKESEEGRE